MWCGCWELNSAPLKHGIIISTSEPSPALQTVPVPFSPNFTFQKELQGLTGIAQESTCLTGAIPCLMHSLVYTQIWRFHSY